MGRRQLVPATITVLALACGLAAFEAARGEHWAWAFRLILLAAVFDGFDGMLARRLAVGVRVTVAHERDAGAVRRSRRIRLVGPGLREAIKLLACHV